MQCHQDSPLLSLPDEMIVKIMSFLPLRDILNLYLVDPILDRLSSERKIMSKTSLGSCIEMDSDDFRKFFRSSIRCSNISELNLNGCFWLLANDFKVLRKMENLRSLHMFKCRLTLAALPTFLSSFKLLEEFSWTWNGVCPSNVFDFISSLKSSLNGLKSLHLEITNFSQLEKLSLFLSCTPLLETLEIRESKMSLSEIVLEKKTDFLDEHYNCSSYLFQLPCLKKCKIVYKHLGQAFFERFVIKNIFSKFPNHSIRGSWTPFGDSLSLSQMKNAVYLSLDYNRDESFERQHDLFRGFLSKGLPECESLKLDWCDLDISMFAPKLQSLTLCFTRRLDGQNISREFQIICERFSKLVELNLLGSHFHVDYNPCIYLGKLKHLKSLSIPSCLVGGKKPAAKGRIAGAKRNATGQLVEKMPSFDMAEFGLNLQKLIIRGVTDLSCPFIVMDSDLMSFNQMMSLTVLELNEMRSISKFTYLQTLCKNCKLSELRLTNLGPTTQFSYKDSLIVSLSHCKWLKVLKLQQKTDLKFCDFQESLKHCKELRELYFLSEKKSSHLFCCNESQLRELFKLLPELVVFYLVQPLTLSECRSLYRELSKWFKFQRPAFQCAIRNKIFWPCDKELQIYQREIEILQS